MKKLLLIIAIVSLGSHISQSQTDTSKTKFILDLQVIELPYSIENEWLSYSQFSPGMQGSMLLSKSVYETQKYYTKRLFFKPGKEYRLFQKILRSASFAATDFAFELVFGSCPLGSGWVHEEWHRAVMNRYGVESFDEMNTFPIFKGAVSVDYVTDEGLAAMKSEYNPDFVRLSTAGLEGQYELVKAMQKDNFFNGLDLPFSVSYLYNIFNNISYVRYCSMPESDDETIEFEESEGADINARDFTGWDFTAWIYDLSRPNEAYSDRGLHPSGTGVRRYRRTTDLTTEELDYLVKMGNMQYLNLISPHLLFINSIKINQDLRFNFSVFHYLTSFGYDVGSNFFVDYKHNNVFVGIHNYHNLNRGFVGIEIQLINKNITIGKQSIYLSPSVHLWAQPEDQDFRTEQGVFGGRLELGVSAAIGKIFRPYFVLSAKTNGWAAGDIYLEGNFNAKFGISAYIK